MKKRVVAGILFAITLFAAIYGISIMIATPHHFLAAHSSFWGQCTTFSTLGISPTDGGDEGGSGKPFSKGP